MKTNKKVIMFFLTLVVVISSVWAISAFTQDTNEDIEKRVAEYLKTIVSSENSPKFSSNPYDYIKANQEAYNSLVALGEHGFNAMLNLFQKSNENGLKEYIMAIACDEIMGNPAKGSGISSGREWFLTYGKNHA